MSDVLSILYDALECKVPERVPSMCLGPDYDFMERYIAEIGFTFDEYNQFKKDGLPFMCPNHLAFSAKMGIDFAWLIGLGQVLWLDEYKEPVWMTGGRFKVVTRESSYIPPEVREKRPIPHVWWIKEGLTTKKLIKDFMNKTIKYRKMSFKNQRKIIEVCEKKYNLIVATGLNGPWENIHFGIGFGNVAKFWRKDKAFLHDINDFFSEIAFDGLKKLVRYAKPKIVMCGDDYGFNSGLQMNINMWREIIKPKLAHYVKIVHDAGLKFVLHSCGNIGSLFKDFIEIGIDGIESLKPRNNDLVGLKKKYGKKIALLGTIDDSNMLKYSTTDQVRKSVRESIRALGPGGYIPGATNFLLDQPVDNICAMFEEIKNYKIN